MLVPYRRKFVRRYHEWMKDPFLQGVFDYSVWSAMHAGRKRTAVATILRVYCVLALLSPSPRDDGVGAAEPGGGVRDAGLLAGRPQECVHNYVSQWCKSIFRITHCYA